MVKTVKKYQKNKYKGYKRKREGISFGELIYRFFAIIFAAALLVSYASVFIDPTEVWIPMFFGLYFIPIALVNLLLLIIGAFRKRLSLLIPLLVLLPSIFVINQFVKVGNEEKAYVGDHVKVLTYNVGRYEAGARNLTSVQSAASIRSFIKEQDADIVCLQEVKVDSIASLDKILPEYPFRSYYLFQGKEYFGNVTLSKHRIVENRAVKFEGSTNLCLKSDIQIGERLLSIYNCHLESNSISFTTLIKRLNNENFFSDEIVGMHEKLRDATLRRATQVRTLLTVESESNQPSLVCGDLNDTPLSYTYYNLSQRKKDSFVEAGSGFSSTYSKLWPLLRIDYILLPKEYQVDRHEVKRIPYSDHYPVAAVIYFDNE